MDIGNVCMLFFCRNVPGHLRISGTQQINTLTASVGSRSVSGTQYGDVTIVTVTGNREHDGGTN